MKTVERIVITVMSVAMLFAFHQMISTMMSAHGWRGLAPSDWAAWVQAAGSILAIFGSVAIATRSQRFEAEQRKIEELKVLYQLTHLCLRMAIDVTICLEDVARKIDSRQIRGAAIGVERLDQIQQSLHICAAKDVPQQMLTELLVLQREVAYTLIAIREIGGRRTSVARHSKAIARANRVARSRDNLRKMAVYYRKQIAATKIN